ncbi:hypothetical protein D3C75_1146810 [compost metagenome]
MDKILAVKDRDAGKILKGGCDQVVVIPNPADGGIRVEARQNGIGKGLHALPLFLLIPNQFCVKRCHFYNEPH